MDKTERRREMIIEKCRFWEIKLVFFWFQSLTREQ